MTIEPQYILLCENAIVAPDGKISLINIFEQVTGPNLPLVYGTCYIAARFKIIGNSATTQQYPLKVEMYDDSDKSVAEMTDSPLFEVEPFENEVTKGIVLAFPNLIFEKQGMHRVQLTIGESVMGSIQVSAQVAA